MVQATNPAHGEHVGGEGRRGRGASGSRSRPRLSAQDWADAALTAIGEGGLAAVAVEPLAARLGTTKGSFYWHFANREALIEAALARWEQTNTEAIITAVDRQEGPERRLRHLFAEVTRAAEEDPLEVALLATAAHPQVAPVLRRVTDRRIAYVAQLFTDLGYQPRAARDRALLAYTSYLGHTQLSHAVPESLPREVDHSSYVDWVVETLLRPS
ncbi:TetR/AcrR family transcriptional regulator [Streptomyces sp. NPDC046197]|uniref:TetR/AcrR family transcriptional regulator n=1 Tax=Streptomyces sp. NPDC046197 TaxID=3154337 RepID=UPI0033C257FF